MAELEGFGLNYERYSLSKCLRKLVNDYNLKECLELPATGVKALPSIYSFGLAEAGANVTLVNTVHNNRNNWERVGLSDKMTEISVNSLYNTELSDNSFDLVWNFAHLPSEENPDLLLGEMARLSNRYVAAFLVNGRNIGSYWHLFLHKMLGLEWTHGNKVFLYPRKVKKIFQSHGLKNIQIGLTNAPFWPDSVGFRDVRLHRQGVTGNEYNTEWEAKTLEWMENDSYPLWIKAVWCFESIPVPKILKMIYAHIYYIIGEK